MMARRATKHEATRAHATGGRQLVVVVALISLALTSLTVWAVARQSRALQQREWGDLRHRAAQSAAERMARLRGDLEGAFLAATLAWQLGGTDALDWWVRGQRRFAFAIVDPVDAPERTLPISPMQEPLPQLAGETDIPYDPDFSPAEAADALARLDALTQAGDPLLRARALLGLADCYRKLGDLRAAATKYEESAAVLRDVAPLARHAFEPETEAIACWAAAGDRDRARQALERLLARMENDHPARYRPAEIELLRQRSAALRGELPSGELAARLDALAERAAIRAALPAIRRAVEHARPPASAEDDIVFAHAPADAAGVADYVVAMRRLPDASLLAVARRADELMAEYWLPEEPTPWRVTRSEEGNSLLVLGPEFAGARVVPDAATARRLRAHARRRLVFVALTGAASVAAWALVIWMMTRAMAGQRELVRLQRRFVADVSHELKTPLAMIRLLAETLADGRVREPAKRQSYYETITRESERLTMLLDSILDFSRIESGRKTYEYGPCDVGQVARQAWALFEPQFVTAGFERKIEVAPDLPEIKADVAALQQVIVNLLQNAFRYSGDGRYVRLAVEREGFLIVITVEDRGIGMSPDQLQRLGDTFFRAEDTRVRQTRGSGLGLAIVNHVVQAHGGKLEVQSRPGKGSTFTVWIPLEPPDAK